MSFEKYPGAQEKPKTPDKKESLFTIVTNLFDYEVAVKIERGEEKIRGEMNRITKKAEVVISPEGIKASYDFFKKPETQESINNFFRGFEDVLRERLKKHAREKEEAKKK